jgi:hypothetical protein
MIQKIPAQLKQAVSLLHSGLVSIGLVAIGFAVFLALAVPLGAHVRDYWKDMIQAWSYPAPAAKKAKL